VITTIYVVICDTVFRNGWSSHDGDRKTFEKIIQINNYSPFDFYNL